MTKAYDLVGTGPYGDWEVVSRADNDRHGKSRYWCKCRVCGKHKEVNTSSLLRGLSESCGCWKLSDVSIGQRFRFLVVVRITEQKAPNGTRIAECLCDCGKTHYAYVSDLVSGDTKSCGHHNREQAVRNGKALARRRRVLRGNDPEHPVTPIYAMIRASHAYHSAMAQAKRRDGWRCVVCKSKCDVSHHCIPVSHNQSLADDPRYIASLCNSCHREIHGDTWHGPCDYELTRFCLTYLANYYENSNTPLDSSLVNAALSTLRKLA